MNIVGAVEEEEGARARVGKIYFQQRFYFSYRQTG